jgi:hypothetical protein
MKYRYFSLFACIFYPITSEAQSYKSFEFGSLDPLVRTELEISGELGYFDSNLGTLTGATLLLSSKGTTTITLTNNSTQAQTPTATSSLEFLLGQGPSLEDPTPSPLSIPSLNDLVSLPANQPELIFSAFEPGSIAGSGGTATSPLLLAETNVSIDLHTILSDLRKPGGGEFILEGFTIAGLSLIGGGGNMGNTQDTFAGFSAKITYTYTPFSVIPEPSQAISTLALCTFGLMLRRRASKR